MIVQNCLVMIKGDDIFHAWNIRINDCRLSAFLFKGKHLKIK